MSQCAKLRPSPTTFQLLGITRNKYDGHIDHDHSADESDTCENDNFDNKKYEHEVVKIMMTLMAIKCGTTHQTYYGNGKDNDDEGNGNRYDDGKNGKQYDDADDENDNEYNDD